MDLDRLWDLRPSSPVVENLEHLDAEAKRLRAKLVSPLERGSLAEFMNEHREIPIGELEKYKLIKKFSDFVKQITCILGENRVTRILFANLPNPITANSVIDPGPTGDPERWASGLLINIEHELEAIDKKRMLWMTVCSSITATIAAVLAGGGIIIGVIDLLMNRS